ncbi:MAG: prolipoprotein diacylglyceryl transferase family protein [Patescibacteria group bacterium]|nr:prolipoprotein diacylglyceryl transferase family protein [Patescibacteria group bacterium]
MWPTIISIGPIAIHSFGVLVFLGIFLGGFVYWQKGREESFNEESLMDVFLSALLSSLILGRVWYVFSNWSYFSGSIYRMLFLTKFPGISFEGVLLGGLLGLTVFSLRKSFDVWKVLDLSVFTFLIIEGFAFIGSFFGGSNLGAKTNLFFGISFPGVDGKRYPVQLFYFICFWGLYKLLKNFEKKYRGFSWYCSSKGEAHPGFLIASYLIGTGLIHVILGFISQERALGFSISLMFIGGLILILRSGINLKREIKKDVKEKVSPVKIKKFKRVNRKRKKKGFDFK